MSANPLPSAALVELFHKALNSPRGIEIGPFESVGAAINWSQRANTVKSRVMGKDPTHEWRTLSIRRVGESVRIEPADSFVLELPIKEL